MLLGSSLVTELCSSAATEPNKFTELCSSAAIVPNKFNEFCSSAATEAKTFTVKILFVELFSVKSLLYLRYKHVYETFNLKIRRKKK